jgi:hypothetical protein
MFGFQDEALTASTHIPISICFHSNVETILAENHRENLMNNSLRNWFDCITFDELELFSLSSELLRHKVYGMLKLDAREFDVIKI